MLYRSVVPNQGLYCTLGDIWKFLETYWLSQLVMWGKEEGVLLESNGKRPDVQNAEDHLRISIFLPPSK